MNDIVEIYRQFKEEEDTEKKKKIGNYLTLKMKQVHGHKRIEK